VGNSCNLKKIGLKKFDFPEFLEYGVEFWHSTCASLQRLGGSMEWQKIFQDFLETFPPEGAKCFYRVSKSSLIFYY